MTFFDAAWPVTYIYAQSRPHCVFYPPDPMLSLSVQGRSACKNVPQPHAVQAVLIRLRVDRVVSWLAWIVVDCFVSREWR